MIGDSITLWMKITYLLSISGNSVLQFQLLTNRKFEIVYSSIVHRCFLQTLLPQGSVTGSTTYCLVRNAICCWLIQLHFLVWLDLLCILWIKSSRLKSTLFLMSPNYTYKCIILLFGILLQCLHIGNISEAINIYSLSLFSIFFFFDLLTF